MKCQNPFSFKPVQVTFWTTAIYLAVIIPLIYVHETVPSAPSDRSLYHGLNLTEAWHDLQNITNAFHPYNSRENDRVRDFLIDRSKEIVTRNNVPFEVNNLDGSPSDSEGALVTIFNDLTSNVTKITRRGASYFEGSNFYVYIRGTEDPNGDWWNTESDHKKTHRTGGVLVNCHFDSVSTGYGATDDGMGCVTLLQLLSYFTSKGRQPRNGLVLLFNNAEEDGLFGAEAFGQTSVWSFLHTFVNLEGAGAGGRAMLFRASDLEISKAYAKSPHPFGSSVAGDAFDAGAISSRTDYEVFKDAYGMRGMDIAFYAPRARYHSEEDDTRHTSVDSIWHMLSAALASTDRLSKITSTVFNGDRPSSDRPSDPEKVQNGKPTPGVWFDFVGSAWATFALRGLFAWSLTLLVAAPLILLAISYLLARKDKYYFFARDIKIHSELNEDPVRIGGWKGFFRWPLTLIIAGGLTIASALLVGKVNPFIVYSSPYAIWAMSLSLFYFIAWLLMRGSSFVRPTALHRGFAILWLFIVGWGVQVAAAVFEDRKRLGMLYPSAFLQTGIFVCLFISLIEMFSLPPKHEFANQLHDAHVARDQSASHVGEETQSTHEPEHEHQEDEPESEPADPTETTPLRSGEQGYGSNNSQPTFASTYRQSISAASQPSPPKHAVQPYAQEQSWSGHIPRWTWFVQFLLLAPAPLLIIGNLGLVAMSALHMTGSDGAPLLTPILAISGISVLVLLPITPFIHRVTHHVPLFLLLIFIMTLIYNLVAFPFSVDHRYKFYFREDIDLVTGSNTVTLVGNEKYVRKIIANVPAASGQQINCKANVRRALSSCSYDASSLPPKLADGISTEMLLNIQHPQAFDGSSVQLLVDATNSRKCNLVSSRPFSNFVVEGGSPIDKRFGTGSIPEEGLDSIELWRRSWTTPWNVTLSFSKTQSGANESTEEQPFSGGVNELKTRADQGERQEDPLNITVTCAYSDANKPTTIPALHQLSRYMPPWSVLNKIDVGLVLVGETVSIPVQ